MKLLNKFRYILWVFTIIVGLVLIYIIDFHARYGGHDTGFSYSIFIDNEYKIGDDANANYPKEVYQRNFENINYKFPRLDVSHIKIYKNLPFFSRLTRKTLSKQEVLDLKLFFNSPSNFSWGETTWTLSESEYIIRFYDEKNAEIGKIWICLDKCGMTFSNHFTPNMKYGGLSTVGHKKLEQLLKS